MSMQALQSQAQTLYTDVNPGSVITVTDTAGLEPVYEATVLEVHSEFGQNRIPALVIKIAADPSPRLLFQNGTNVIRVVTDSRILASAKPPEGAVRARTLPHEFVAAQFTGGSGSATQIIQFAAGKARIHWEQGNELQPEAMVISSGSGEERARVGDLVLIGERGVIICTPDAFSTDYEVIEE